MTNPETVDAPKWFTPVTRVASLPQSSDTVVVKTRGAEVQLVKNVLSRDASAEREFRDLLWHSGQALLGRLGLDDGAAEDVLQDCLSQLLHPADPKIRNYRAEGSLRGWLRAFVLRKGQNYRDRKLPKNHVELMTRDGAESEVKDSVDDSQLKSTLKVAFKRSWNSLNPKDREMLELRFLKGLQVNQIADALGVHRMTVSRNLGRVQLELRGALEQQIRVLNPADFDSHQSAMMRMINSHLSLSLGSSSGPDSTSPTLD